MFELSLGLFIVYCMFSYFYMLLNLSWLNSELNSRLHLAPKGTKPYQIKLALFALWIFSPISLIFLVTR